MVWLKNILCYPIKKYKKWQEDRKFKKKIKELQKKDPFIYK
jgi:hypothetical protein|tara:strand:- start:5124 stop:5246 length:123 start_codon:yes stop_codon:yes gene_type:complete